MSWCTHTHTHTCVELQVSHQAPPQVANRGELVRYDRYRGNKIPGADQNYLAEGTPNNKPSMGSVLKNIVSQVSNLGYEENLAINSDRVKVPVVGAGFTDFRGSWKHDVANLAGAKGDNRLAPTASKKTSDDKK